MANDVPKKAALYNVVHGPEYPSRKSIKGHLKKFSSVTTAHGVTYLAEDGLHILERIFWLIVVCTAIVLMTFQTLTLYQQWQDDPVVTTLDTVALPIQELDFPAITICPQGSMKSILEVVLFNQFERFIRNKRNNEHERAKRENSKLNMNDIKRMNVDSNNSQLTYQEMMMEVDEFLKETYPGAKDKPTKLVHLLTSDQPEKMIANEAVLSPEDDDCDTLQNEEILEELNKRLNNETCSDNFQTLSNVGCIHDSNLQIPYNEATRYCQSMDGSLIFDFSTK